MPTHWAGPTPLSRGVGRLGRAPSVGALARTALRMSAQRMVQWPERFRGGCSFGADPHHFRGPNRTLPRASTRMHITYRKLRLAAMRSRTACLPARSLQLRQRSGEHDRRGGGPWESSDVWGSTARNNLRTMHIGSNIRLCFGRAERGERGALLGLFELRASGGKLVHRTTSGSG